MLKLTSVSTITWGYKKQFLTYFLFLFQYFFKSRIIMSVFLLFTQICISQAVNVNQLLMDGEKAFVENDFLLAKEIYTKAVNLDMKNKHCWFNLAVSELKLEEKDNACEHFYQAYLLNDGEALKVIKENCPNFRNGEIMSIEDVEEKPKFIYKEEEYLLFEKNDINRRYIDLLRRKFRGSKILCENLKGQIYIQFTISKDNFLDIKVLRVFEEKKREVVRKEIDSILNNMVVYVSAKNNGLNVDLWEKWTLPVTF